MDAPTAGLTDLVLAKLTSDRGVPVSEVELALLVYLTDWKAALDLGAQATDVCWATTGGRLDITAVTEAIRGSDAVIELPPGRYANSGRHPMGLLDDDHLEVLRHVHRTTSDLTLPGLAHLVASTWPVLSSDWEPAALDLVSATGSYRRALLGIGRPGAA